MRRMFLVMVLAVACSVALWAQAPSDPMFGTWRLNVEKSTFSPGPGPKSEIARMEYIPNGMKTTTEAVNAQGVATRAETTAMFDGKEYEQKREGVPTGATFAYTRIDSRTHEFVTRFKGKITVTRRSVVSADGKTRTATVTGTDTQGRTVRNVQVYERQ